jgi:RNA polymerase sigma-70 factor, ECF subfamily
VALRVEDIDLAADRELVERWQAGEHDVFDDLYRRYFNRLRSYCHKRVGDRDAAEEIAQEAFVKALQALPKFAGERRFYPWVTVIASRLCVDHHRRLGRVRPMEEIDAGSVDGDHGVRLAFLADVDNLDRAMQRLGPRHLQVLELREREGMTYAEIADHLAVPQSTVEALLFRARKALRREFMAVSGEGKLAGIPVIGVLIRRLTAARGRLADAMPSIGQLGSPIAAGAVAAVMTVAPFSASQAATPTPRSTMLQRVNVISTSSPMAVDSQQVAAAQAPPATPRSRTSSSSSTPSPSVEAISSEEARDGAGTMPLLVDLGDAGAGADPTPLVQWLTSTDQEDR